MAVATDSVLEMSEVVDGGAMAMVMVAVLVVEEVVGALMASATTARVMANTVVLS